MSSVANNAAKAMKDILVLLSAIPAALSNVNCFSEA